jgi:hypothetical protein
MKLICKHTHNAFIKGKVYEGVDISNGIMIIREKDQKKFFYSVRRRPGCDFIETWFWTLEELRNKKLEELGI